MVPIEQGSGCSGRGPVGGREGVEDVLGRHGRQSGQDVAEVGERVDLAPLAGHHDRVDDRSALACVGMADKQVVLLADRRGPDGVFYAEMAVMLIWKSRGICLRVNTSKGACE